MIQCELMNELHESLPEFLSTAHKKHTVMIGP